MVIAQFVQEEGANYQTSTKYPCQPTSHTSIEEEESGGSRVDCIFLCFKNILNILNFFLILN